MSLKDKEKWNSKYQEAESSGGREPSAWLKDHSELLSGTGRALDLACGEGRNAVYLAEMGYNVLALDIAEAGLKKAETLAQEKNVRIETLAADLDDFGWDIGTFDVVVCFYFLDRKLFSRIRDAVKPGGLVFYETFTLDYLKYSNFKEEWVLSHNELLTAFNNFRILRYRDVDGDETAFASIVARKEMS